MLKRIFLIGFLALVCCKTGEKKNTSASVVATAMPMNVINKEGIELRIYDYDGFESFLNKNDDQTYVINFWATWCKPCIEELPYFEQLNENYKEKGVKVILVSLDMPRMFESQLIPFIKDKKLQSEVVVLDDPKQNTWIPKIDENWSGAIPATLIYKNDQKRFYEQSFTYADLEDQLLKFLN